MTTKNLDFDACSSPEEAIAVLRAAADRFAGDALELQSAWQDKHAGAFWRKLARDLERLADKADGYNI